MRLLVLYPGVDASRDQPGYYDGFERMVSEGKLESHAAISVLGVAQSRGWDALWDEAFLVAKEIEADAVLLHFFHSEKPDPSKGILRIKKLPNHPLIVSSLGDPFGRWAMPILRLFRIPSALSDVSFLTGMGDPARKLVKSGSRNLVLMPNGCCQVRFAKSEGEVSLEPEFDVCFVGNRPTALNPFNYSIRASWMRVAFVNAFAKRYGKRFGLFGKGWGSNPAWQGEIPYANQHSVYRRGAVAVGGMPYAYHDYYTSDRVFIATSSGVPFVDYWVPGVDRLLMHGRDWWLGRNIKEMLLLCDKLLEMPSNERIRLAEETRKRMLTQHSQYNRCLEMIEIVKSIREARRQGRQAPRPVLPFLIQSGDISKIPEAVMEWRG